MPPLSDERRKALRDEFIEVRGYWNPFWDGLLDLDPDFFDAYLQFSAIPWRKGPLEPKIKSFMYLAIDAAATHLYAPGIRQHIKNAIGQGATQDELMEVLELTATLGIHACNIGVPILVEELAAAGQAPDRSLSARQEELKAAFTEKRGYWHEFWHDVLVLDPDFFAAYIEFSGVPWTTGVLEPKVKEFVYMAFDIAATHLYEPGFRLHVANAIGYGATREELMEVIEIASVIGIHSCTVGVPILLDELAAAPSSGGVPAPARDAAEASA